MKSRLTPVVKNYAEGENVIKMAIECFEGFEYCYKLSPQEIMAYSENNNEKKETYLFPSLRPSDGEFGIATGIAIN